MVVVVARGGYRNKIVMCSEVGDFVPEVPLDLKSGGVYAVGILFVLHKYLPPHHINKILLPLSYLIARQCTTAVQ